MLGAQRPYACALVCGVSAITALRCREASSQWEAVCWAVATPEWPHCSLVEGGPNGLTRPRLLRTAQPDRCLCLTSIPGVVIELSPAPAGGVFDCVTWADVLQLPTGPRRPNWPSMLNHRSRGKDPQVIAVSPSALSGFRLRPPAGPIQEDSLKQRGFALVSATAGA